MNRISCIRDRVDSFLSGTATFVDMVTITQVQWAAGMFTSRAAQHILTQSRVVG